MAFTPNEAWVSDDQTTIAVKKKGGGYLYYVTAHLAVNKQEIADFPAVARAISNLAFEIVEAKK